MLWSAVFITVSTLYRPVDQLLSRHISERLAQGEPIGEPMRVAATIQLGLALGFAVRRAGPARSRSQDDLLDGNETLYWVFFARGPRLRGQLLRPRLPGRAPPLRPLHGR